MAAGRHVELKVFTSDRQRHPRPSVQTPPHNLQTHESLQYPTSPLPPSQISSISSSSQKEDELNSQTISSTLDNEIISNQLRHVLTGDDLPITTLTPSPSTASSITSTESIPSSTRTNIPSETREELFRNCLTAPTIDVDELRRLIWAHGTPSTVWARPLAWKLLVGYLPPDRAVWDSDLRQKRERYWTMVHDVTVDPTDQPIIGDHPLSNDGNSQWREYFEDSNTRSLIQKDVKRTHPDLHRFIPLRDPLERILFIYAKTHPEVGYRQGMNELAAPFLIVFADVRTSDLSDIEADAYFCFESIMQEMIPCYAPSMNQRGCDKTGIARQLKEMQALLRIKDPKLEKQFEQLKIDPQFYGLRWILLWFSQEFSPPDVLALWDSLLTAQVRLPWIRYVCVAMAIRLRDILLASDFAGCIKMLLNYPDCDISELLRIADRLRTTNVVIVRTARR